MGGINQLIRISTSLLAVAAGCGGGQQEGPSSCAANQCSDGGGSSVGGPCAEEYVVVFAGQSNMQGENTDHLTSTLVGDGILQEYLAADNSFRQVTSDDMETYNTGEWHQSLARSKTGSMIPAFAKAFNGATGASITAISTARGGAGIYYDLNLGSWRPGSSLFADANQKIIQSQKDVDAIVYLGGETDVAVAKGTSYVDGEFKQGVQSMIDEFTDTHGAPIHFILPSHINAQEPNGDAATMVVRNAIREVVSQDGNAYVLFEDNLDFRDRGLVFTDIVHYNQAGQNEIGAQAGQALAAWFSCEK